MNDLTVMKNETQTMSSREIAELTGKQHAHIMRDIRTMLETLEKDVSSFGSIFKDSYGRDQQEYRLDRELSITLVTGYDVVARNRIIKRWMELEAGKAPKTYLQSLKELVATIEAKEEAEKKVELLTEALDRDFGYVSIIRAAKFVGVKETRFKWQMLKAAAVKMSCPPKRVPSARYQYQLLYPIAAFVECYPEFDFSGLKPDGVESIKRLSGDKNA